MKKILANKELKNFFILFLASFSILLLDQFQLLSFVKNPLERLTSSSQQRFFRNYQQVLEGTKKEGENKEFKERIKKLEQEIAILNTQYLILNTKYSAARRLLGTPLPPEWQFFPAQTAGLIDGSLTIDKGENDDIKIGQTVLVENIFVGVVKKTGQYQAQVRLPIEENAKFLVKVIPAEDHPETGDSEAKAKGLLTGNGGKLKLEKVLQKKQLNEGDLIVTSEFPPNLIIGKIKKVIKNEVEIYQSAEVEPFLDYQKLEIVFILKN